MLSWIPISRTTSWYGYHLWRWLLVLFALLPFEVFDQMTNHLALLVSLKRVAGSKSRVQRNALFQTNESCPLCKPSPAAQNFSHLICLLLQPFQAIDAAAEAERLASKEYKEEMAALAKENARQARLMGSDKEPTRALTPNVLR